MIRRRIPGLRAAAVVAALTLAAGCSGGGASDGAAGNGGGNPDIDTTALQEGMLGVSGGGEPTDGGTLTFGAFSEPRSLDPAVSIAAGTTGGIEMINIYDTLMRYDTGSQEVVPQLAKGLEADAEYDTWTLTLRDGVTFSNGKPLDAGAVKFSQERYASMAAPEAALWNANVASIKTPDDSTVVYELKRSWPGFANILSTGPGMVVAKASGSGEEFEPVGAGPFTLAAQKPGEKIVLAANPGYYGGQPHLETLEIVYLNDQQTGLDSMQGGGVDAALIKDPDLIETAVGQGLAGYLGKGAVSSVSIINAAEGRPGADPRVRKAMQLAVDPQAKMERVYGQSGMGSSTLFPEYSRWHSEVEGLPYDPEQAKQLLEEAKADGFDGKVEFIEASDPASRKSALAFKAQLEAVGFEVELNLMRSVAEQITEIAVEQNYDVAAWGMNLREADPFSKMYAVLHSEGAQSYGMYTSDEMDALIEELQATAEHDKAVEVMARIQEQVNQDVPFLNYGASSEVTFWDDEQVHGIVGASSSMWLADEAWVS